MKIEVCNSDLEKKLVVDGINKYNDSKTTRVLEAVYQPVEFIAKNDERKVIGGVLGYVGYYAGFKINTLWVAEEARGKNIGTQLLEVAENKARNLGATIVILDTFSFQAEEFYIKNGYEVFGKIENYPKKNQQHIYLKKSL